MSGSRRIAVAPALRIGPWIPGFALPAAIGVIGVVSALLLLHGGLFVVGLVLALVAALRVRTAAPWVLAGMLVVGQLLLDPADVGGELALLVLAVHLIVVLTMLAAAVPARARLQLAALIPAARTLVLVQLPAQVLGVGVLLLAGRTEPLPVASTIGGVLLLATAALLVLPRVAARTERD